MPADRGPRKPRRPGHDAGAGKQSRLQQLFAEQAAALEAAHLRLRMSDRLASIGALAAGLGHDMNNVLLPVRAHLEAARSGALIPQVRRHVEAVLKSVAYLQQLADGLHFLARDAEGDESERAATDVAAWWSQVGPLLTKAVPGHVRVKVAIPPDLPLVAVSAHGLTQAVLNLVINAGEAIPAPAMLRRKRMEPTGSVRIAATVAERSTQVKLSVADNGRGMSEETQRRAFEMFYTTRARGLGTGLGLPLVARVVSRAGGSVHIDSRLGAGTTVSLLLPVARRGGHKSPAPHAVVALAASRDAAMVCHLLEAAGVRVASDRKQQLAGIWVAEPTRQGLAEAKRWRKRRPRGGLVLMGKPGPESARAWTSLGALTVADRADLALIRSAIGQAIARS
jgi:signal transduction histidine kinase